MSLLAGGQPPIPAGAHLNSGGSALAQATYSQLFALIAAGTWPVGSKIPTEPELAEQLQVGRSTIREAVRSLATIGMVETRAPLGTFVVSDHPSPALLLGAVSPYSAAELISTRRALLVEAVQGAAGRHQGVDIQFLQDLLDGHHYRLEATDVDWCADFHGALVRECGNRLLAELHRSLEIALVGAGVNAALLAKSDAAQLHSDHSTILESVAAGDVGRATHAMAIHLDRSLRAVDHSPIATDLTPPPLGE